AAGAAWRLRHLPGALAALAGHRPHHLAEGRLGGAAQLPGASAALAGGDRRARLGAVAAAMPAGAHRLELDPAHGPLQDVGKLDFDAAQDVAAGARAASPSEAESGAAEEGLEDLVDRAEASAGVEPPRAQPLVPVGVVGAPPLGVGEHLVGLGR